MTGVMTPSEGTRVGWPAWRRAVTAWAALAVLAVTIAACGGGHTITGTFTLTDSDVAYSTADCHGTGGYSDIRVGAGVVVKDGAGKTIGTTDLTYNSSISGAGSCAYAFTVEVPNADFYAVEVGRRGALTYSKTELEARGWVVGFTLGK